MIPDLMWIIGIYVAAAAMAHGVFGRSAGAEKRHYVLVAGNHQTQIEWYVRALQRFSRRTGTDIGITVLLADSSDETGSILEKFARDNDCIGLIRQKREAAAVSGADDSEAVAAECTFGDADSQIVWVDLGKREDLARLPL